MIFLFKTPSSRFGGRGRFAVSSNSFLILFKFANKEA